MKCSICDKEIKPDPNGWSGGHNPWPINDGKGKCCGECNDYIVVPRRIQDYFNREAENGKV